MNLEKPGKKQFNNSRCSVLALGAFMLIMTLGNAVAQANLAAAPTSGATEVKIDNFAFTPAVVTVKTGAHVTWVNKDDIPHTVDSTEGKFKSGALDTDEVFEFVFTQPGEYPFYCRMHPRMTGKIIVQP